LVTRQRLLERLERGVDRKLTLVCAPAGWGKTTLLAAWAASTSRPVVWLSLDEEDSDLGVFVQALAAAVRTVFPDSCEATLALGHLPTHPSASYAAYTLANDLAALSSECVVVLDDYHLIQTPEVHALLRGLLSGLPAGVHLMVATRSEPALRLTRLRGQGELAEVRTGDLAFREEEVRALCEQSLGAPLSASAAAALADDTEGWGAGVRLAVRLLENGPGQVVPDAGALAAGRRHARQLIVDEVLAFQPTAMQAFLLRSAVLERFCAPLCDALADRREDVGSGEQLIEDLVRDELFVVCLDEAEGWYRFHHLFRDALLRRLYAERGRAETAALHLRASAWFAGQGSIEEAVRHALAAGDETEARRLVAANVHVALDREELARVERWLDLLPDAATEEDVALLLARAWVLRARQQDLRAIPFVQRARRLLDEQAASRDPAEVSALQAELALLFGARELLEDPSGLAEKARLALDTLPRDRVFVRSQAAFRLAYCLQLCGRGAEALQSLEVEAERSASAPAAYAARLLLARLAILWAHADLDRFAEDARELLSLSELHQLDICAAWARYGLGLVAYERNELDVARRHFQAVLERRHQAHYMASRDSSVLLALTEQASGNPLGARAVLDRLGVLVEATGDEEQRECVGLAELRLALQRGDTAIAGAKRRNPPSTFDRRGWPGMVELARADLVRLLLARGTAPSAAAALRELDALQPNIAALHDTMYAIETLAWRSLAHQTLGELDQARAALSEAVALAAPHGLVRTFLDLGPRLAGLLPDLEQESPNRAYVRSLLEAFAARQPVAGPALPSRASIRGHLIELPTVREMQILALLADGMTNREIALTLHISWHTVTKHTVNIYGKLQATNRREAVRRARTLGLIGGGEGGGELPDSIPGVVPRPAREHRGPSG
jgi:LuxR family maltose regulon positive regulatory protein